MDAEIRDLFARYEAVFNAALAGDFYRAAAASLYAPAFVAATPAGVTGGAVAALLDAMPAGYARNREIGTRAMRLRDLRITPVDALHALVHAGWRAIYRRDDLPETEIAFEVHYMVQIREGEARVFGWMSGDESALLRAHGVI